MAKEYKCPACQNVVDQSATVCSNPVCRVELAFCSHCRDVTTYSPVEPAGGRFGRVVCLERQYALDRGTALARGGACHP